MSDDNFTLSVLRDYFTYLYPISALVLFVDLYFMLTDVNCLDLGQLKLNKWVKSEKMRMEYTLSLEISGLTIVLCNARTSLLLVL